jgi:hypothetical protein
MGHHAQYRKRGSTPRADLNPNPPPSPLFSFGVGSFTITSRSSADPGGTLAVYESASELGPFVLKLSGPWQREYTGSTALFVHGDFYYAQETGNGADYTGPSDASDTLQFP